MSELDWLIVPYEYGIELHCPDCHNVIYHQEHATVSLGDIKTLIAEHECASPLKA